MNKGLIKIRNFDNCTSADIPLEEGKLVLLGGKNGEGKTSILTACAAALVGTRTPVGGTNNDGKHIKDGADKAAISFTWGESDHRQISWAKKGASIEGDAPCVSEYSAGLKQFTKLDKKDRALEVLKLVKALPDKTDFDKAIKDCGCFDLTDQEINKNLVKIWGDIEMTGWDTALKEENENGKVAKRMFHQIMQEEYGVGKVDKFNEGLDDKYSEIGHILDLSSEDLPGEMAKLDKTIASLKLQRDTQLKAEAAASAIAKYNREELEATIEAAKTLDELIKLIEQEKFDKDANLATSRALWETYKTQLKEKTEPRSVAKTEPVATAIKPILSRCPHCAEAVVVKAHNDSYLLQKPGEAAPAPTAKPVQEVAKPVDPKVIADLKDKIEKQAQKIGELKAAYEADIAQISKFKNDQVKAEDARKKLQELDKQEAESEIPFIETTSNIDSQLASCINMQADLKKLADATKWESAIKQSVALQSILAPEGLRKIKLASALEKFNQAYLAPQALITNWGTVAIEPDFSVSYLKPGKIKKDYQRISKSERWRARLMLQIAIAASQDDHLILIDDCEILVDKQDRSKTLNLLLKMKMAAVMAMACTDPASLPDLAGKKAGQTFWVENGIAEPIAAKVAVKV